MDDYEEKILRRLAMRLNAQQIVLTALVAEVPQRDRWRVLANVNALAEAAGATLLAELRSDDPPAELDAALQPYRQRLSAQPQAPQPDAPT